MFSQPNTPQSSFSLAQARNIVRDLFTPNARIYWTDFLVTILTGHICYGLVRKLPLLLNRDEPWVLACQGLAFVVGCLLYYRASLFIHELVHLPQNEFQAFRFAWNLLCGVPFLIPSFVYYTHIDHHRRKHFGTKHDGEYMPLGLYGCWYIAGYLALSLVLPIATIFRFAILTPLTWLHSGIRNWVHRHWSSMVMDPRYLRPLPTPKILRVIRVQEVACLLMCLGAILVPIFILKESPLPLILQGYCTGVFIVTLNAIRTMGAHRWWHEDEELNFVDQMLDSVTVAERPWISGIWGPIGTRYHSLHHLFPSMPYHHMPEAHRRLMAQLPADSPYRQTVEPSLTAALRDLFRRSQAAAKLPGNPSSQSKHDGHLRAA
jgi:fatty acid desaturase